MTDDECKNQDLDEIEGQKTAKKSINLSQEERDKRAERMRKLRAKLDDIGNKPVKKEQTIKPKPKVPIKPPTVCKKENEEKPKEKQEENNDYTDDDNSFSSDSEEEIQKPIAKKEKQQKIVANSKRKVKPTPRKVMKIKYYEEPTQAEMLQDRIFLENQHKHDTERKYMKPNNQVRDVDDLSNKLFNY